MINLAKRQRILLVGAGRRIQNNFLPALSCLSKNFEVCGIYSRTLSNLTAVAKQWNAPIIPNLSEFDFSSIDIVVISVPTSQNSIVLKQISERGVQTHIVIDTPIAWNQQEYADCTPLLKRFTNVTVTEDYMNFPRFSLIRDVVRKGLIGRVRYLTLYNIGYLYHGLALIRSFVGFAPVVKTWTKRLSSHASVVGYEFKDKFVATVIGPYRRHTTGGLLVEGTKGIITEFPFDKYGATDGKPAYVLSRLEDEGSLSGFKIHGKDNLYSIDLPDMRQMRGMNFGDKSDINLERGCGLIEVFRSLIDFRNINQNYGFEDAFYDSFVSRRAESGEMPVDPLGTYLVTTIPPSAQRTWIANTKTFIKSRPILAANLDPSQKIEVATGTVLESASATLQNGHLLVTDAKLEGKPLPNVPWFIYEAAWSPQLEQKPSNTS